MANVGAIFNMFGAYGDVVCIKILKNKRDCALVQMAKPHHALQVRGLEVRTVEEVAPDSDRLTVVLNRVADPHSFHPDPDPAFWAEYRSGSGSRALMTKNWTKNYS